MGFLYIYQFSLYSMLSHTHHFCPICFYFIFFFFLCSAFNYITHVIVYPIHAMNMVWLFSRSLHYANEKQGNRRIPAIQFCGVLLRECKQRTLQIFSRVISILLILFSLPSLSFDTLSLESNKFSRIYRTNIEKPEENKNVVYVGMDGGEWVIKTII